MYKISTKINVEGVVLPNKPLTNFEILSAANTLGIPHFRGVFQRDVLPKKALQEECGILNLDDSLGDGSHWTAWFKSNNEKYYFDSFGVQPPRDLTDYLKPPMYYMYNKTSDVSRHFVENNFIRRNGSSAVTGSIDMTGNTLHNVGNPTADHDVATKTYVDSTNAVVENYVWSRKPIITFWAEEKGAIEDDKYEWSYRNHGSEGRGHCQLIVDTV